MAANRLAVRIGPTDTAEVISASASFMVKTDASERVLAALESRKCWAIGATYRLCELSYSIGIDCQVQNIIYVRLPYAIGAWHVIKSEEEWAERAAAFLKHKLQEGEVTYAELAKRLKKHGFKGNQSVGNNKLKRGTFPATWFLPCLAALELDGVALEEI